MSNLRERLKISNQSINEINSFLLDPNNKLGNQLLKIIEEFGGPDEINRKAEEARNLENLISRLKTLDSPYLSDIEWLIDHKENKRSSGQYKIPHSGEGQGFQV